MHVRGLAAECVEALNGLYASGRTTEFAAENAELSAAQQFCLGAGVSACDDLGPPEPGVTPVGALRELCGFQPGYAAEPTAAACYQRGLVSLPPVGIDFADPAKVLTGRNLDRWCSWRSSLLCDESVGRERQRDCGVRIPHSDPFVRDRMEYGHFVSELLERRLIVPRQRQAESHVFSRFLLAHFGMGLAPSPSELLGKYWPTIDRIWPE